MPPEPRGAFDAALPEGRLRLIGGPFEALPPGCFSVCPEARAQNASLADILLPTADFGLPEPAALEAALARTLAAWREQPERPVFVGCRAGICLPARGLPCCSTVSLREPDGSAPMGFVDGFLAAVPNGNREAYRAHAALAAEVFREHGALRIVEAWGADVPHGRLTDMHRALQATAGETIVFSWIEWPSREARDAGLAKVFADPRLSKEANPMPFDGARMIHGGFAMLLDTG
jgi:uncharacterized protein YbaA (DUF1428 family)